MDVILAQVKWQHDIAYNNDIIILSKTKGKELKRIEAALLVAKNEEVIVKLKRWLYLSKDIDYLEHVIVPAYPRVVQSTTEAIRLLQYQTVVWKIQSIFCLCSACCGIVPKFAALASPLNKIMINREPRRFRLNDTEHSAVKVRKQEHSTLLVLVLQRLNGQYITDRHASDTHIRWCLIQEKEGRALQPIESWFRLLCNGGTH